MNILTDAEASALQKDLQQYMEENPIGLKTEKPDFAAQTLVLSQIENRIELQEEIEAALKEAYLLGLRAAKEAVVELRIEQEWSAHKAIGEAYNAIMRRFAR